MLTSKKVIHPIHRLTFLLAVAFGLSIILGTGWGADARAANAATGFKAGYIISDSVFNNKNTMNPGQIQTFMNAKVPSCQAGYTCLKDYRQNTQNRGAETGLCGTYTGGANQSSAQIIYDVAQVCGINPQVILVLLQKEQGLVTDDWPVAIQYQSATGYGCPDSTPGQCDSEYYGFFNQIYHAARQYKKYARDADQYSYRAGRNNTILYNPQTSCGSSTVFIQNQATAGLYNYTPYRPNQAALNAGYGSAPPCGAYGNRNFWLYFNDWFGSSIDQVTYVQQEGSSGQYLLYDGKKQALTYDGLLAWGIQRLPLIQMPASTLNQIPSTPNALTRFGTVEGTTSRVFSDTGNYYDLNSNTQNTWGNFKNITPSTISWKLIAFANHKGNLPFLTTIPGDTRIFAMEGGALKPIPNPTMLRVWAGKSTGIIPLSADYRAGLTINSTMTNNLVTNAGTTYYVDGATSFRVTAGLKSLLPSTTTFPISSGSLARYKFSGNLSHLIKSKTGTAIYAIDKNSLHKIQTFQQFNALRNSSALESKVSADALSLIPIGSTFKSAFLHEEATSNYFVANKTLSTLPARLVSEYPASLPMDVSPAFISVFPKNTTAVPQFVKSSSSAAVYFVNQGAKLPITRYDLLVLLGGANATRTIADIDINAIPTSSSKMSALVKTAAAATPSVIDKSGLYANAQANLLASWNIANAPVTVSQSTYDWLAASRPSKPLARHVQTPSGEFCFADKVRYCAEQHQMIFIWNLTDGVIRPSSELLSYTGLNRAGALGYFLTAPAGQPNAGTVFAVVDGNVRGVGSPDALANLGHTGKPFVKLQSATIDEIKLSNIHPYLLSSSGTTWVIDSGKKRKVASALSPNWVGSTQNPTAVSAAFLSFYPEISGVTKSVTSSSTGAIYGMDNGLKRGITTYDKYITQGWSVYTPISPVLLRLIPTGSNI